MLPDCFDCKYGGLEHPCRTASGTFDFAKVASSILATGRAVSQAMAEGREPELDETLDWVSDCEYETIEDHPHLLVPLITAAIDACATGEDAGFLAAGLIENALVKHGPGIISDLEVLAAREPKARFVLSGVWRQGDGVTEDVWQRLKAAVAEGPVMEADDPRNPGFGLPPERVASEQVTADLLKVKLPPA